MVIGIFLRREPKLYRNGFLALIPAAAARRGCGEVLDELGFTLWWWLMGQLATMASVGIFIGIGLTMLGVPLSGTLGLMAAILSFIPSLGPFISVIPAIMLGLTISPTMGAVGGAALPRRADAGGERDHAADPAPGDLAAAGVRARRRSC